MPEAALAVHNESSRDEPRNCGPWSPTPARLTILFIPSLYWKRSKNP